MANLEAHAKAFTLDRLGGLGGGEEEDRARLEEELRRVSTMVTMAGFSSPLTLSSASDPNKVPWCGRTENPRDRERHKKSE